MKRLYRDFVDNTLLNYEVSYKDTDLLVSACRDMKFEIFEYVRRLRIELESYIEKNKKFATSLKPIGADKNAISIAKDMIRASKSALVGPMACVAGAFAEYTGKLILKSCPECIVENGGDIFLKLNKQTTIGVYTQNEFFKDNISVSLKESPTPYGICASSAKIGPSLSKGRADLAIIIAQSAILADGLATKTANMITEKDDIKLAIEFAKTKNIIGCLFIKDDALGVWGDLSIAYN
jgi:ApbE superfamily uncharacterized protein (UPF0280 family)